MSPADRALWPSDEWVEQVAASAPSRPPAPGCTGTVTMMIGTGKRGARDVHYHWTYRDGVPVGGGVGPRPDADLTLTITPADALEVASGVSPSVAFMRGRLKATGDGALLLGYLASTATEEFEVWRSPLATGLLEGAPETAPGGSDGPKARKAPTATAGGGRRRAGGARPAAGAPPTD